MVHRGTLLLSAALTAACLVVVGGVAGQILDEKAKPEETQIEFAAEPASDQAVAFVVEEREQAYRALVDEANQKLESSYRAQEALSMQLASFNQPPPQTEYGVSPELAVGLALSVAPGATQAERVELVNFQGTAAYEIILDSGTVYIGAENAWLLHNGAGGSGGSTSGSSGSHHDDDDDHEDEHEDEDDD